MLTRKESELLHYIAAYIAENQGVSPSFDEMVVACDLKSKSGIHRLLTALEERGFIARAKSRARAIEVIRLPGAPMPTRADIHKLSAEALALLRDDLVAVIEARNTARAIRRADSIQRSRGPEHGSGHPPRRPYDDSDFDAEPGKR